MSDLFHDALTRGLPMVARGNVAEGLGLLTVAAGEVDVDPRDYDALMQSLRKAFAMTGRWRGLASVAWYQGDVADEQLFQLPPAVDVARSHRMRGDEAAAARAFEDAGLLAHAAIARERARDPQAARALWSRLAHRLGSASGATASTTNADDAWGRGAEAAAEQSYVLGLVRYNVARNAPASRADRGRRDAIVTAVGALEEAAARFETLGLRERAFDCYNALSAIGATTSTFEHALEGRVNAIRILREDYLQQFALQQYDEAIGVAEQAGEYAAAATFAREAMTYARSLALPTDAQAFARRAIELHLATARAIGRAEGPPELAENALLAAIALAAELGLLARARELYLEAAAIPGLDDARRGRHLRGAAHLEGAEAPARTEPKTGARPPGPPLEVWLVDVLEWEQGGRAQEACADILFDAGARAKSALDRARDPASAPLRRRALVGRLVALDLEGASGQPATTSVPIAVELVRRLGQIVDYRVLAPLEALARDPSPEVRARAVEAAGGLPFKRSAQLLRAASDDDDARVVAAAAHATARKQSAVFVDPLRRLARDARPAEVRLAALRALSNIDNAEAAEAVLVALEAGSAPERATIVDALRRRRPDRGSQLVLLARDRLRKGVSPEVARDLEAALGSLQ